MSEKKQKSYALEVSLIVLALIAAFLVQGLLNFTNKPSMPSIGSDGEPISDDTGLASDEMVPTNPSSKIEKVPTEYFPHLSDLEGEPVWGQLDSFQHMIIQEDFVRELNDVYTIDGTWNKWIEVYHNYALIKTHAQDLTRVYRLNFLTDKTVEPTVKETALETVESVKFWRPREDIVYNDKDLPLQGVRIVLDPGHIGGNYAKMEKRKFKYQDTAPVQEGNMTLVVANLLERQLRVLGAEVELTRSTNSPVNPYRVEDYQSYAQAKMKYQNDIITPETVERVCEKLFFRAGEIRERAKIINSEYKPDLVVCIHFNAADSSAYFLYPSEHLHMILNGAYTEGEVAMNDQRFQMVKKILQGNHSEEAALNSSVAKALTISSGLPPYLYEPNSKRALNVNDDPYLWARNLAANRSFDCPVVYCEPYLFNGVDSHARIQVGDYEGLRYVNGMLRSSIFREYVTGVTEGLVNYYKQREVSE